MIRKVGPKHPTMTDSIKASAKGELGRRINFQVRAQIPSKGRSLVGRVQVQKPSKADRKFLKKVQSLLKTIPTAFIKR